MKKVLLLAQRKGILAVLLENKIFFKVFLSLIIIHNPPSALSTYSPFSVLSVGVESSQFSLSPSRFLSNTSLFFRKKDTPQTQIFENA